jgi:cytochrome c oxidase subunit IV
MKDEHSHIASYRMYAKTLIILLFLTALNIILAILKPVDWTNGIILLIASVQAGIALTWFMHVKWDSRLIRTLVIGVFILYAAIVIITFLDYNFR